MKRALQIIVLFFSFVSHAQTKELDSLRVELMKSEKDTNRVFILLKIGFRYYQYSPDSLLKYTTEAMDLSEELNFTKGIANGYNNLGTLAHSKSDYQKARENWLKFLSISEESNDLEGVNKALNNLGIVNKVLGNYAESLTYYERSLGTKKASDLLGKAGTLNNIGLVHYQLGNYSEALEYFNQSLDIKKEIGNEASFATTLANIGTVHKEIGEYEIAMDYYERSLVIDSTLNKLLRVASLYQKMGEVLMEVNEYEKALRYFDNSLRITLKQGNKSIAGNLKMFIGDIHFRNKEYSQALNHLEEALGIYRSIESKLGMTRCLNLLGELYLNLENYTKSIELGNQSLKIAKELGAKKEIGDASKLLCEAYQGTGNFKKALEFALLHKIYTDSILSDIQSEEIANFKSRYEIEKISAENEKLLGLNVLNETEIEKGRLQIQRQNTLIFGGAIVLILSLILTYTAYRYYQTRKKSIDLLQAKNNEILLQSKQLQEQSEQLKEANQEVVQMNESLEELVKLRTQKMHSQNEKLREYTFSNAHLVRAPLANILGLTALLKENNLTPDERKELNSKILTSAEELDQVVRKVNDVLGSEE
jgi:tetratricopeptide (TPR) repeat protein